MPEFLWLDFFNGPELNGLMGQNGPSITWLQNVGPNSDIGNQDKAFPQPDDQSAVIYLISTQWSKWGDKIYLEGEYYLESYWIGVVGCYWYDNITRGYTVL